MFLLRAVLPLLWAFLVSCSVLAPQASWDISAAAAVEHSNSSTSLSARSSNLSFEIQGPFIDDIPEHITKLWEASNPTGSLWSRAASLLLGKRESLGALGDADGCIGDEDLDLPVIAAIIQREAHHTCNAGKHIKPKSRISWTGKGWRIAVCNYGKWNECSSSEFLFALSRLTLDCHHISPGWYLFKGWKKSYYFVRDNFEGWCNNID